MSLTRYFGRDIKLRHLRLLAAIADAGRLSQVARQLHVTQPALSKALAEIESAVGAALFERTPGGLVANDLGAAMVRAARAVLAELDRAGDEMSRIRQGQTRSLTIGAMPTTGPPLLAAAATLMLQDDPKIALTIVEGSVEQLLIQLAAGRLDVVVGARPRRNVPPGIEAAPLYDDPLRLVLPARHPLLRRRRPAWQDLERLPWVLPPPTAPLRAAMERLWRQAGMTPPRQVVSTVIGDLAVAFLEHAGAVSVLPSRLAALLETQGLVRAIDPSRVPWLTLELPIEAFTSGARAGDAAVRACVAALRQAAAERATGEH